MATGLETSRRWPPGIGSTELVWHRANGEADLDAFLRSSVRWAECDARADRRGIVRASHEPLSGSGGAMPLHEWLGIVRDAGRSAKIDLKEDGSVLDRVLEWLGRLGWRDGDLWFNAAVEVPRRDGFRRIVAAHPGARISCPLDTLASYLLVVPQPAMAVVDALKDRGVNWLSLGAQVPELARLVRRLHERGWPINIWDVPDARALGIALALQPEAVTADLDAIPAVRSASWD